DRRTGVAPMPRRSPSLRLRSTYKRLDRGGVSERESERVIDEKSSITLSLPHPITPPGRSSASAPAKLILCGEHAVVYGRPAIALPLAGICARAEVADGPINSGILVHARDLRRRWRVADDPHGPISELITSVLAYLEARTVPSPPHRLTSSLDLSITISSAIPIASGMGSGAAVATALVRALAAHQGQRLSPAEVSSLVYTSEQRFHGMPSGIDHTVIAYERPIWFQLTN